jgi:N-acetyltransferase
MIGSSRYWNFDPANSEVEIGWTFLERPYWGGNYNRELKQLMLDHAFRFVENVVFVVGGKNRRSQKAVEKIGGKFLLKTERPNRHGHMEENVIFRIERSAWRAQKKS